MKSYKSRHNEQVYVESLLAKQEQPKMVESTMSLDTFFIGLGEAAKKLYQNGAITYEQFQGRLAELKRQYNEIKRAA